MSNSMAVTIHHPSHVQLVKVVASMMGGVLGVLSSLCEVSAGANKLHLEEDK